MFLRNILNIPDGALLNKYSKFFDSRIGQSTTLCGRQVIKHMSAQTNEYLTGEYDHMGESILYGDSVTGDTLIETASGTISIELLYNKCKQFTKVNDREYGMHVDEQVLGFNGHDMEAIPSSIDYIMRHLTSKEIFKITATNGYSVKVTADHSIMVDRAGFLKEVKPLDIQPTDLVIVNEPLIDESIQWIGIQSVESIGTITDYVYDISIEDQDPYFFANGILVHNTDSCFFSAWSLIKDQVASGEIEWNKDICIQLYDTVGDHVNSTFPAFMEQAFHTPRVNGEILKAGREIVGDRGLFITKKRYAINYFDKDGKRTDINGKRGKVKAMGLDLKRSDTPKYVQKMLSDVLDLVLEGKTRDDVIERIKAFKVEMKEMKSWTKGSPKGVNKLTYYKNLEERGFSAETGKTKTNMPGHVRAALNWNRLKKLNGDQYSPEIIDGAKVIVCKLKPNAYDFTSVAYPVDLLRLPQWFIDLPFDDAAMEETLVDEKINNLIGILNWDVKASIDGNVMFNDLFDFT